MKAGWKKAEDEKQDEGWLWTDHRRCTADLIRDTHSHMFQSYVHAPIMQENGLMWELAHAHTHPRKQLLRHIWPEF